MTLGDKIRELRVAKGMTLRALASAAGISAPFLSDIEHDRRRTDKLEALAAALGIDPAALQELDDRPRSLRRRIERLEEAVRALHRSTADAVAAHTRYGPGPTNYGRADSDGEG